MFTAKATDEGDKKTAIILTHSSMVLIKIIIKALKDWHVIVKEFCPSTTTITPTSEHDERIIAEVKGIIDKNGIDLTQSLVLIIESNLGSSGHVYHATNLIKEIIEQIIKASIEEEALLHPTHVLFYSGCADEHFSCAIDELKVAYPESLLSRFSYISKYGEIAKAVRDTSIRAVASVKVTTSAGAGSTSVSAQADTTITPILNRLGRPAFSPMLCLTAGNEPYI